MPNPKRKHSKARGRKRRTHWTLKTKTLSKCPQCKAKKLPHRVCSVCGYYNGKLILDLEAKKIKREEKKKKKARG